MKRLSILAIIFLAAVFLAACAPEAPQVVAAAAPRAPDDPTPTGIDYVCEGRKQVAVVYARNRASVTHAGKTWRMEYQASDQGFRYFDASHEWVGRNELASLRDNGTRTAIAYNCRPSARTS